MAQQSKNRPLVFHVIGGSARFRAELARTAFANGHHAEIYDSMKELLDHRPAEGLIVAYDDPKSEGMPALLEQLGEAGLWLPLVAVHEDPDVGTAVRAIKAGAIHYSALPLDSGKLMRLLRDISDDVENHADARRRMIAARNRMADLSPREREVLDRLAEGNSNKVIAQILMISPRTVEIHRASMMRKLGARHAAEAVRVRLESGFIADDKASG